LGQNGTDLRVREERNSNAIAVHSDRALDAAARRARSALREGSWDRETRIGWIFTNQCWLDRAPLCAKNTGGAARRSRARRGPRAKRAPAGRAPSRAAPGALEEPGLRVRGTQSSGKLGGRDVGVSTRTLARPSRDAGHGGFHAIREAAPKLAATPRALRAFRPIGQPRRGQLVPSSPAIPLRRTLAGWHAACGCATQGIRRGVHSNSSAVPGRRVHEFPMRAVRNPRLDRQRGCDRAKATRG